MAKIKNITVKVTYMVGLGGLTAPKEVIGQLKDIVADGDDVNFDTLRYLEAVEWIQSNIKERDCFDAKFEIIELES